MKQVALHHLHPRDAVKFLLASLIGGAPSLLLCTFHFATGSVYDSIKNECNLDQLIEPEFPAFFLTGQPELEGGRPCDDFGAAASHGEWRSGGAARPRERARARRAPVPVTKSGLGIFGFLGSHQAREVFSCSRVTPSEDRPRVRHDGVGPEPGEGAQGGGPSGSP